MATTNLNKDAAALLDALGLCDRLTIAEANAQGYYTTKQLSSMSRGVSQDTIQRIINNSDGKYECVKIAGSGATRAYRLKRQKSK
jgi:hypothetical protein